jgi:type IV secretory pathway protease TraF
MKKKIVSLLTASFLMTSLLAGCGQSPTSTTASTAATPAEPATSSSRDFGNYVLYFNAIRTDTLTPEIAKTYNIARSANRALLNISMVKKVEGTPGVPVPGSVTVQAVNLNGQFKDLAVREVREGDAIYYIGDVAVANDETLVFTVDATPSNETSPLSVRFQRQFFGD